MPCRLCARDGQQYLSPRGVLVRLQSAFPYVESDGEEGRRHVLQTIAQLQSYKGAAHPEANLQYIQHLNTVKDRALYVCFGDDPTTESAILSMYVIAGTPLVIEYSPLADEKVVQSLLIRCATTLGYNITKDRRINASSVYRDPERRRLADRRIVKDRRKSS